MDADPWLQLRDTISGANVHNANQIAPSTSATFTADILGLNTGGSTAAGNLTGLATFPSPAATIYTNASPALATSFTPTSGQYVNGAANASPVFTSNGTKGTATINAVADSQTLGTSLVIGFTPEFVNPAGNDNVALAFSSAACGAGNTPCFATIGAALANVAVSGVINIQSGTYAENPNFNQNCTTNITGNVTLNSATLTNGTFNASSFTTTLASGNFTNNGGTFTQGTSTVAFTPGAGAQTIGGTTSTTFNNLTINNASGVNLGNSETVGGTLTLTNGVLGVGTNTLTLTGPVSFTSGTIGSGSTGTVNYTQTAANQNVAPGSYGNLFFNNFVKVLPNGATVGILNLFTPGTAAPTVTGSIVDFNGTSTQTVPAINYNNLTISGNRGGATVTLASASIGVAGTFNPSATNVVYSKTGNTINFNGSGAQTIPTFNYNSLTSSSSGARTLVNGGTIGIGGTFTPGTNAYTNTGNTIDFNGAGGQTIPAFNYNSLTSSNSGARTLANSGTVGIAGVFTQGTNAYTITGSTIDFNGAGGQTIPGFSYNNLTSSSTGTRTLDAVNTIKIAGVFTPGTNAYTVTGSTLEYNGSVLQTLPSGFTTYNNLTINNAAGASGFAGLIVQGLLRIQAGTFTTSSTFNNVQIDVGAVLTAVAGSTINVGGNWVNNGTFNPATGTVNFNGAAPQAFSGTFNNLSVNNAAGVTLNGDSTVNGTLALTNGDLKTGAFTLTQPNTTASTGTGDVVGNVKRTGTPLVATALTYGNPNNVITLGANTLTSLNVRLTKTAPDDASTGIANSGFPGAVQRTYVITPAGGTFTTATLRLHYLDTELNSNTEGILRLWKLITTPTTGWQQQDPPGAFTTFDSAANWVQKTGVTGFSPWTISGVSPTAVNGNVSGRIVDTNGNPVEGAVVRLSGTQNRKFITDSNGYYSFDNVETNGFYTVTPSRANYLFNPSQRSFSQLGHNTEAAFTAAAVSGPALNPLDTPEYFVRQQYLDFLGREPDESGFNFWSDGILSCNSDASCVEGKRINTSAAFFLSIEFQQTGYLIYRMYQSAYGDMPGAPVPLRLGEFRPDTAKIGNGVVVLRSGWEAVLENNKQAYVAEFVQRARFLSLYAGMSDGQFVDTLNQNAGFLLSQAERDQLVSDLSSQAKTRAQVLRAVAENPTLSQQKFNQAFVLMQYFGYLRRDPDGGPDTDFGGYNFWLNKLNTFGGNYQDAEMVRAFLVATEYRGRFPR